MSVQDMTALFDYEAQPKESVDCGLCGGSWTVCTHTRDRYGYEAAWRECQTCSLNFLSPRMTREAYARFYETGAYRRLVSAFHGREINAETIQEEQREYAVRLMGYLECWISNHGPLRYGREFKTLLDVGGSTGVVAHRLSGSYDLSVTIVDPSSAELAMVRDAARYHCTLESFEPGSSDSFDLVTLCQTADHLLDLMGSLKKIRGLLSPDGLFWSDIVDFDVTHEVKIDHPFNLTERTYREFLKRAGFKLLQMNYAPDGVHVGFLAR